tara:strand:+ start:276 stop:2306 length:2031 start_codon:yes stop_codon:yes gene_type:complete
MANKLTKAQERKLELQEQEIKNSDKIIDGLLRARNLGVELTDIQEGRLDKALKERTIKEETTSLEKKLTKQSLSTNKIKSERSKLAKAQLDILKKDFENNKKTNAMTEESFKSQSSLISQIAAGSATIEEIQSAIADLPADAAEGMKEFLEASVESLETQQMGKDVLSQTDSLIGGMGSTIKGFLTNPLTAAFAILMAFNATQQSIADQFGAIGVKEFRSDLATANAEFAKFGLSAADAQTATSEIANNFGLSVSESSELAVNARNIKTATGATLTDSAKLLGIFKETQNLTAQQAENLLISTTELAVANNVAPDKILADVAQNTEFFAKFAEDGGKNILRAAVQAKKLGLELSDVEKITSGLLDFQNSLNAEIEASVILGRNINLQKARELALANDVEGATAAVVEQLGTAEEFNRLNAIERQKLAAAAGLEVSQLQKIVNKEKEALTLSSALSKQQVDIIPEDAINQTALLIGQLTSLGITLAEVLGPPLNFVVGVFANAAKFISALTGGLTDIVGPTLTAAAALGLLGKKLLVTAIKGVYAGVMMLPPPLNIIVGGALAAGLISQIYSSISEAEQVGDLFTGSGNNGPIVTTPQGKRYEGSVRDEVLMAPNIAGVAAAGGGGTDTSRLENKQNETNSKLERVASVLENALSGPKPALARAMGSSVGDSVEGMA